jgi:hypothetical protein
MVHVWCSHALMIPVANCELGSVCVQSPAKSGGATFSKEANFTQATFCNQEYFYEATFSNKGVKLSEIASPRITSDIKGEVDTANSSTRNKGGTLAVVVTQDQVS